ncbi:MAG TPA: aldehyde dehydrogenase family protein [Longimicrobiaceae bacterium]|nr:aldehyde dehydrogenase family protein [Longimicrobiaceae bacterium]
MHTSSPLLAAPDAALHLPCYVAGRPVGTGERIPVHDPYSGALVGTVAGVGGGEVEQAIGAALRGGERLSRQQRFDVLVRARSLLLERAEAFARLITAESGLCIRDTRYEVGRAADVLQLAAVEALRDDGEAFSGDVSPQGKARRTFTVREPHRLVAAITPFNHPLNQVLHKLAPAVAVGAPVVLKPSEKTPLTAVRCAELLYEAGLPTWMLSVLVGPITEVAERLVRDPRVEVLSFTGSAAVGKRIASAAGYKRVILELGDVAPLIVLDDADLALAAHLAAEGSFRNSGQRCTAVKRILVDEPVLDEFTVRLVEEAREYTWGDPADPATHVGTVIDEEAAIRLERTTCAATEAGARVLLGGERRGALLAPTVIADVPRDAEVVTCEAFGPLAPVVAVRGLDDAVQVANAGSYGLAAGVVTRDLGRAVQAVKELRVGMVNVNEVPGYRTENAPFGGIKDSGLGVKEGVVEAMRGMSWVKTFSIPW